jgi:hypothetical protein
MELAAGLEKREVSLYAGVCIVKETIVHEASCPYTSSYELNYTLFSLDDLQITAAYLHSP